MPQTPTCLIGLSRFENDPKLLKGFDEWRAGLERLCPDVDIDMVILSAHQWLLDNQGNRKGQKKAYRTFLSGWAKRDQAKIRQGQFVSTAKRAQQSSLLVDEMPDVDRY